MSSCVASVSSRLRLFLPIVEISTKHGKYLLKSSCTTFTERQTNLVDNKPISFFISQYIGNLPKDSGSLSLLYQSTYILELIHTLNFFLMLLLQGKKITDFASFEQKHASICFQKKWTETQYDQTITMQVLNSMLEHIFSQTVSSQMSEQHPNPNLHWLPILNTSLFRNKKGKSPTLTLNESKQHSIYTLVF